MCKVHECDFYDELEVVEMPERSILYRLSPIDSRTAQRESLSSYFCRLADAHSFSPQQLADNFVLPRIGNKYFDSKSKSNYFWQVPSFNGIGDVAEAWSSALQRLTSVSDLHHLTLLSLKESVSQSALTAKERRWCVMCFREMREVGVCYGKLIWEIEVVTACPRHGIKLAFRCDCNPDYKQNRFQIKYLPNICKFCGRDLGESVGQAKQANDHEMVIARLVEKFLNGRTFNLGFHHDNIAKFMAEAVERCADGKAAWLAKILEVGKSVLHDWLHNGRVPSFTRIVSIAGKLNCDIDDIFQNRTSKLKPMLIPQSKRRQRVRAIIINVPELKKKLEKLLEQDEIVSVAEAARRLGLSKRVLYLRVGDLAKQVAARRKKFYEAEVKAGAIAREKLFRLEVVAMLGEGIVPTRRRLMARLGSTGQMFRSEDKLLCNRILAEERKL